MRKLTLAATLCAAALFAPRASASVSVAVSLDELAQTSFAACEVSPASSTSVWEDDRIVTYTRVEVVHVLAGAAPSELWVRTLGGVVGHVGQLVEGEAVFRRGEHVIVFLSEFRGSNVITARAQGELVVDAGHVRRNVHVGALVGAHRPAGDALDGKTVGDAESEIAGAWRRTHASP